MQRGSGDVRQPISPGKRLWIERVQLTNFRSYSSAIVEAAAEPVVLVGPNGAGKTNFLEAISLLAPGQGLRRAAFSDLVMASGDGSWSVAGRVHTALGVIDIGTGLTRTGNAENGRSGRIVRIDGEQHSGSGALADYVEMVWLTPAMDGLFTGPAGERRRFLDRLILCFDAGYRTRVGRFERAMQSRNKLLSEGVRENALLEGFEMGMAENGVAVAAQRAEAVASLAQVIERRRECDPDSLFPWAELALEGTLETLLADHPAVEVEDLYMRELRSVRERDRAAGRALSGPHRSDLVVGHGPKAMPARLSSTGEQKALLFGIVLAHAELVAERQGGLAPILLLDEVTAHFDVDRRAALFAEIVRLGAQAWMTGTDPAAFEALRGRAQFRLVCDGGVARL
ncbi:MAG: DNA replication/repair protein RecF [Hyphomicrobiaceae bacterium]|nr:DNA replication/repair protein RecF [Hyphomicrobiaceae bacterium]MCC0011629.1 DNA replication/repair protein RecF [Hyphomicrobiaceae bacterium]